jgi:hypothetical protein
MKKLFFCVSAIAMVALGACSNFETSDNGSMDGFWQLTQIDTLETGCSQDVRERLIFWSVQANIIELSDRHTDERLGAKNEPVFYYFDYSGDSLKLLAEPRPIVNNRRISDRFAETQDVSYYGFENLAMAFRVLRLEETKMTLQSETYRMHFRKY